MRIGRRGRLALIAAALLGIALAGCGKRGSPQPPLRRSPARVTEVEARRLADRVELRFTVPATNSDGSTPPTVERVEVYMLVLPANTPPTVAGVTASSNLKMTVVVRPPPDPDAPAEKPPAQKPPDTRPAPGDVTTVVDKLSGDKIGTAEAPVAHYVVVGVTGRRKGPTSPIVSVPLGPLPAAPTNLQPSHDEKTLTLAWTAGAPEQKFRVYLIPDQVKPEDRKLLTAEALSAPTFATPVTLAKEQCFLIAAVQTVGKATIEGAALGPVCVTPADKFPPLTPERLRGAVTNNTSVLLDWAAVDSPDLAGYLVLRTDGTNDTLQPLTRAPIAETTYEDKDVKAGVTYAYAVVAVDKATPPNQSAPSARYSITVRSPFLR
ncbi:MAG TPA: hypothetical protein VES67_17315 [Vicinamibacterales bacterium]|nr:hypothetical protein [Vicinamibacterales bacterium]